MVRLPSGKTYLEPAVLLERLEISLAMRVGIFGAGGSGYFTLQAAEMVGSKGRVYAVDIFKPNLSALWAIAKFRGMDRMIRCVWSDLEIYGAAKRIKNESLDRGVLVNVLHQSKKQKEMLRECSRTLKKEGRLLVIDWVTAGFVFGPQEKNIVTRERVKQLATSLGLALMDDFKAGQFHYGLIFTKIS